MNGGRVEVDTDALVADVRRLAAGLARVASEEPADAAERTAGRLREILPRRTGRLASSVSVVRDERGAGVTYGSGVPYARYIDRRTDATSRALSGQDALYVAGCKSGADREARRL